MVCEGFEEMTSCQQIHSFDMEKISQSSQSSERSRQSDLSMTFLTRHNQVIIVIKLLHVLSDFAGHVLTVVIVMTFKIFVTIRTIPRRFMTIMTPVSTSLKCDHDSGSHPHTTERMCSMNDAQVL